VYTERFSLPFVSEVLIAAAERRRPGLGAWSEATRRELRAVFERELAEIRRHFGEFFHDQSYWAKVERTVLEDCFPRYCAAAEPQTVLERGDYGVWRGGDLVARGAYAAGGLLFGLFMVYAPFIPIPREWDFVILASMLAAPFLPDWQVSWHRRRYRKALAGIVLDMQAAAATQALYAPMVEGDAMPRLVEPEGPASLDESPEQRRAREEGRTP
jgi:hypothetical protein